MTIYVFLTVFGFAFYTGRLMERSEHGIQTNRALVWFYLFIWTPMFLMVVAQALGFFGADAR